ncbi:thioesterase domain-containing protein [Streptomyces bauhiniae]|uniref:thioesterase domain-containing protein n=1 Tax=Streptomyces bauhiniae TaxID=2340725 RepID=UPI0035D6D49D
MPLAGAGGAGPGASLYDLGADSLTLLDLISEVKRHFGVDLELAHMSHRVSLTEVLASLGETAHAETAHAESAPAESVSLEVWQRGTGRDLLRLVHPVGGDIQAYRALVSALDPRLTVCLIADPALRGTAPAWSLPERARHYAAALRQRFPHDEWRLHLAGWSFGAWVALEMAAQAETDGRAADGLFLIDPPPPGAGARFADYDEDRLDAVFAQELGTGRSDMAPGRAAQEYAERLARCCRANLASMAGHEPPRLTATPSRLWVAARPVAGLPALGSAAEQLDLWRAHLSGAAHRRVLDTDHYGIVRPPQVRTVAEEINAAATAAPDTADAPPEGT